jgi:hypothetical protein
MGILKSGFQFTGSVSNISAYTLRGSDKIIVRSKGGASKKHIQTKPSFEPTRNLNREWKVVTKAAMRIRHGLTALRPLADYNISGPLNAIVKTIQTTDTVNPKGKRSILFSHYPDFISSFNYNRQTYFDSIVRHPLLLEADRKKTSARITTPGLQPAINFFPHPHYAYCRFVLAMTAVNDYVFDERSGQYRALLGKPPEYRPIYSDWVPSNMPQPAADYELLPVSEFTVGPDMVLIIGAGIQYGKIGLDGSIGPAPHVGAARIMGVL